VQNDKVRELTLSLPASTPKALSIQGLGQAQAKSVRHDEAEKGLRRWHVTLAQPRQGTIRLGINFNQHRGAAEAGSTPCR
jgi:hypothetical protein